MTRRPAKQPRPAPVPLPAPLGGISLHVDYFNHIPDCTYHFHRTFELVYVQGTAGTRIIGDTVSHYRAEGSLILLGPLIPHTWIPDPEISKGYPIANRVVHFTLESLGLALLEKNEFGRVRRLLHDAETGIVFDARATQAIKGELEKLAGLDATERFLAFLVILHRLAVPRHYRCLGISTQGAQSLERDHALFSRVLRIIHKQPGHTPLVADIARQVGVSQATFTRFFRRIARMSFIDYLNNWRIQRAAVLLRETRLPILPIALEVGYDNLAHFNRQFRKRLGTTPSHYRSRHGIITTPPTNRT